MEPLESELDDAMNPLTGAEVQELDLIEQVPSMCPNQGKDRSKKPESKPSSEVRSTEGPH